MRIERPNRVSRSFIQSLCRPPGEVFSLLCPVREVEWVNGWHPKLPKEPPQFLVVKLVKNLGQEAAFPIELFQRFRDGSGIGQVAAVFSGQQ